MKTGISIDDMAATLTRQLETKKDFVAPTSALSMASDGRTMGIGTKMECVLTGFAERQLAAKLEVPVAFYDRLKTKHPDMLSGLVNGLMRREPKNVMVRTLEGKLRAIVSDRFRQLDNFDMYQAVVPVLRDAGAVIESAQLTDTKMYIKALCPWLDRELPMPAGLTMGVGHNFFVRKVIGAIVISNSEVGAGALSIQPGIFEKQCTNLASFKDESFGKMHIGKSTAQDDNVNQYLSDDSRRLADAAVWSQTRDIVRATMDGRVIDNIVRKMVEARGDAITGNLTDVVEVFAKQNRFNETEQDGLLKYLVDSGEKTRYGLQWAVTRLAGDAEDYDRASELERLGGQIIELPRSDWTVLAKAA